jgi:Icc-related predicted phosphoesterase
LISDVHGAVDALRRVAPGDSPLLILGDLINFIDYRNNEGIVSEVAGIDFVEEVVRLRSAGDFTSAGEVWRSRSRGREAEYRDLYTAAIAAAYVEICEPLSGVEAYATYGNVDNPEVMRQHLPDSVTFIEAGTVELDGQLIGIVGGGVPTINSPGEITDDVMEERLQSVGPVDVLCTHVAPAIQPLSGDVIGGRAKGSQAVLDYIRQFQPSHHYFGDIHQPQAVRWSIGETRCQNVGYFRATGRVFVHHAG